MKRNPPMWGISLRIQLIPRDTEDSDVTKTRNGEWGMGNGKWEMGNSGQRYNHRKDGVLTSSQILNKYRSGAIRQISL